MRVSIAFSAMAGGLALGWASLAGAASPPPPASPPAAPIFYCPIPPAAAANPADGVACPGPRHFGSTGHRPRHHEQLATREHAPEIGPEPHHGAGTGHMFWYRYENALNQMGPSCPTWRRPCPPEPPYPIVRESPGPPAYAEEAPPPIVAEPPPAYAPVPPPGPVCPHMHHACPPAVAEAPPPPPPVEPLCHHPHHGCPFESGDYAEAPLPPPPPAPPGPVCPSMRHVCPMEGDGRWADGDARDDWDGHARAAYADGLGEWRDGSYGQVYGMTGRDARGYLVWPGKTDQPDP